MQNETQRDKKFENMKESLRLMENRVRKTNIGFI